VWARLYHLATSELFASRATSFSSLCSQRICNACGIKQASVLPRPAKKARPDASDAAGDSPSVGDAPPSPTPPTAPQRAPVTAPAAMPTVPPAVTLAVTSAVTPAVTSAVAPAVTPAAAPKPKSSTPVCFVSCWDFRCVRGMAPLVALSVTPAFVHAIASPGQRLAECCSGLLCALPPPPPLTVPHPPPGP
jgi:hypothetical protein